MKKLLALLFTLAAIGAFVAIGTAQEDATEGDKPTTGQQPDDDAVKRTRKVTQMLDEIYKNAIVLITDKYVHEEDDFPAGSAAVLLFKRISKGGSHQVRLIDATGDPYMPENVAKDDFERYGVKQLKAGAKVYEKVVQHDGKAQLRTLTPVPVVMDKCIMCHEHYRDVKKGEPIGAISYIVPIE